MKNIHDRYTDDLLLSPNARAQRLFKQKRREAGFVQRLLWVHPVSFDEGFRAAKEKKGFFPEGSADPASYANGYGAGLLEKRQEEINSAPIIQGL